MNGLRVIKGGRSFGGFGRKAPKVRTYGAIPKALGQRLEPKDAHLRSDAHLALVRRQPCLLLGKTWHSFTAEGGKIYMANVVAHHARELFPDHTCAGRRCSDFLTVPLLAHLHEGFPDSLHATNNATWWTGRSVDPLRWLDAFLRANYSADHEGASFALRIIADRRERNAT